MTVLLNPKITNKTLAADKKTLTVEHKQTWYKYHLNQAFNPYGVAAIVTSTTLQYLTENEMDYVGFTEEDT